MRKIQVNPMVRAVGVIGSVAVLVSGVTFAAMQSSATFTDNTMSSGTAGLLLDGPDDGTEYTDSETGFAFTGMIPGGNSVSKTFKMKNGGNADLDVQVAVVPPSSATNIDKNLVKVKFIDTSESPVAEAEYSLTQLEAAYQNVPGVSGAGSLAGSTSGLSGEVDTFSIEVRLESGAVTGNSGQVDNFNFVFRGTNDVEAGS